MTKDILLVDGDIQIDGDIRTIDDQRSVLQSAIENISIRLNELQIRPDRGNILYDRRMKLTTINLTQVEEDCREAILYDDRIKRVPYIKAHRRGICNCDISFILLTYDDDEIIGNTTIDITGGV